FKAIDVGIRSEFGKIVTNVTPLDKALASFEKPVRPHGLGAMRSSPPIWEIFRCETFAFS
ncbi:MAG: hypothetical protein K5905_07730, partial [Roseibium sp.]|uniref:hypothetical protein n=1 Tax=Roseibium sp. TaxID=1936156 RepID=UPI002631D498